MASDGIEESLLIGKLPLGRTAVFMCDLQEKFRPAMLHFSQVIANAKKLVDSTKILEIPLVVTEQYPQGLGKTVNEIDIEHAVYTAAKTKFSMVVPEVEGVIKTVCNGQLKCVVLFGVEAHVCVEQTAMDLISLGIKVHIVADATTSRSQEDRLLALERLKQIGCFVTTSENIIYKLLGDKNHPKFNEIRPLIKDITVETGLVSKMGEIITTSKLTWQYKLELAHSVLIKLTTDGTLRTQKSTIWDLVKELITLKNNTSASNEKEPTAHNQSHQMTDDNVSASKLFSNKEKNCPTCGKCFTRPQDLRRHLRIHDETSSFLCEECGKSYRSPDGLNYHKVLNHPSLNVNADNEELDHALKCPVCSKDFLSEIQLKVHLKNSHKRAKAKYTCTLCVKPKEFERKDCFQKHLRLHERAKAFSCLICTKSFSSRSNLNSHARTFHDTSTSLQCPTCLKKFYSKKRLNSHIPECLSRKFCSSCKFFCQREEDLTKHMKKAHPADYAIQEVFGQNLEGLG